MHQLMEGKMKNIILGLSILLILSLMSCRTSAVNIPNYEAWLGAQDLPSQMDVSGKWYAGDSLSGGWGDANLVQQGRNVSGTLGLYSVKGVVSQTTLFLEIISQGHVYYTAKLDMKNDGSLSGIALKEAIVESPETAKGESHIIIMKRMEQ
jgi:uncharacterized lipoprotein NlpE involved in copper resistance